MKTGLFPLFVILLFFVSCQETATLKTQANQEAEQVNYILEDDTPLSVNVSASSTSITLPTNQVALSSTVTNPKNASLSYQWSKISGSSATIQSPNSPSTAISGLQAGSYQFKVLVSSSTQSSSSQITVTVNPAIVVEEKPPVETAGQMSLWKRQGSSGDSRWYYDAAVFLPKDYGSNSTKKYTMILSLHGLGGSVMNVEHTQVGGNKEGFVKQVWNTTLSNTFPAIVIAPNARLTGATANAWWNGDQLAKVIQDALVKYQIDPKRVIVTGLSAGGDGTNQLIKKYKNLIAAAMPGAYNEDLFTNDPCALADIPVWAFGNNDDGTFQAYEWQKLEPKVKMCHNYTGKFNLSVYQNNCAHGCWDDHWKKSEVQTWLLQQSK